MSTMSEITLKAESRAALKDSVFLHIARCIAELGTCDRKHVGAVFTRAGRCVAWGFNGAPPGMPHCDITNHGWLASDRFAGKMILCPDGVWRDMESEDVYRREYIGEGSLMRQLEERAAERYGCLNATHAEANALAFAAREGISVDRTTLYVSVAPCDVCARLLIAAGISRVVAYEAYRDPAGVDLLKEANVQVQVAS